MHSENCRLCKTDHRFMRRECVAAALDLSEKTISNYGAGTKHLRHITQGGRTVFSRRQVMAHIEELERTGKCEGACEKVFEIEYGRPQAVAANQ